VRLLIASKTSSLNCCRDKSGRPNFKVGLEDANKKIALMSKGTTRLAEKFDEAGKPLISLQQFNDEVLEAIKRRTDIDIAAAESQFKRRMLGIEKEHGKQLSAKNIDKLRVQSNIKSKDTVSFVADVNSEIGRVARNALDTANEDIRKLNARSQQLMRTRQTMNLLQNQTIDTGYWSARMASLVATLLAGVGGAALALGSVLSGGGALVIAAIISQGGARIVANLIRKARFNPKIIPALRAVFQKDKDLLKEVLDEAVPADKALIKRAIGISN